MHLKVSVCCASFNHVKYLKKCIEGVLMQDTNFSFEFIIHDDASTDGTQYIIQEYHKQYPELIIPIFQEKNKFSKGIKIYPEIMYPICKGKYIAICDGDDYWTDPLKLQKQVDVLEDDEKCNICYHRVDVNQNGELLSDEEDITEKRFRRIEDQSNLDIMSLLKQGNFIHTCSVLFRKSALSIPFEMLKSPVGDYLLYVILTKNGGSIRKINESMAVYRRGVGVYSSLNKKAIANKILTYQTCVLSLLEKEEHRKIVLPKVLKQREKLKKETSIENMPVKILLSALLYKVKNKFK